MKRFFKLFVEHKFILWLSVKPETKYLPININKIITGKLANTAPDNKKPQSI